MPLAFRFPNFAGRVASPAARFRLAISLGFVIAAAGALTIGVSEHASQAESIWGSLPDLFGGSSWNQQATATQAYDAYPRSSRTRTAYHRARHRSDDVTIRFSDPSRRHVAQVDQAVPQSSGRQSMCVRLCDGFAFPVGAYHGSEDNASHEATCRSECPGAATALYVTSSGATAMDDAAEAHTGAAYSELPYAFHYTTVLSDACSCHAKSGGRIASLLRDFTLRRGDAVMTKHGFQVFHGSAHFPFRRQDFVALAKSPDIRKTSRATYRDIERASLSLPTTVAQDHPEGGDQQLSMLTGDRNAPRVTR